MVAGIAQKRFSVTEFHKMVEAGILREDDRLELVQGLIVEMPPIGPRHSASTDRLTKLLVLEFQSMPVTVRVANPIQLDDDTELYLTSGLCRRAPTITTRPFPLLPRSGW